MRTFFNTILFSLVAVTCLQAQQFQISGTLKDSIESESLIGANVMLLLQSDSTKKK
jgi:hypothetical protein